MLFATSVFSGVAQSATYTWTGTTDTLWTTTTNWNPNTAAGGPTSADSLVFTGASTVDLGNASRTGANSAYSGRTLPLTVTATNGCLTFNGGNQSFGVQANGNLVTDYSGLSAFTYTQTGNNTFDVRMTTPAASQTSGTATLNLATQGTGTNLIRASTIQVGAAAGTSGGTAWGGVLGLGKANTLNTTTLAIGGFNGSGAIRYQGGVSNGTLVVRGTGGGSSRAGTITVGETSSGTRDGSGILDATGGTIDLSGTNLLIGRHGANSNTPSGSGTVTMPGGSVDVITMVLGEKSNTTGTPSINAAFTQSGGLVTSSTVRFGNIIASSSATTPTFTSVYNLSSGTFRAGLITTEPSVAITATTTANASSVRRIAWSGGTISNYDASTDLTISGTSTNAGYTMQLVLGSTTTPQVFNADSARTITIGANAVISGTGLLQKAGAGTLRINTAATYTGSTSISAGTLQFGVASALPTATALTLNPSAGTATLDLNGFNATIGSIASSGAGAAVIDVAATGTSTLTVGGDNTSTTFAGRLRNSGGATSVLGFTKNGTGTWTLTGSNSAIAGNLVFNNGKVTIDPGSTGSFTSTGRLQMLPGTGVTTTLEILSGSNSFSTAAGIGGMADNSASGTAAWNLSGGATTLALSTNRFLIGNKGTGTVIVSNNAAFTITGTPDLVIGGDQAFAANNATGIVTVSSGTLSITGAGNLILGRNVSGTTTGANGT
ncbi:MAG: beta strand repeat-containing protein, partial [Acidimicrobiia bacterium]